ncbi:heavy metal translocating P-type ATPase [Eubacterium multiforme]|uniref:Cd(2+)-exporting ATPase n=1 Tax=Eubacterium multiforme TaxID=83339 RepID=A0ABT9UXP0_9FIRM|nr:heavy metal translocating P-type ATPase [Eubacterium multiforme]MDQ0151073.1 cation-transporting P-type ATPase C [Eubacterium multiforme]
MRKNDLLLKSTIKHSIVGRIRLKCEGIKYLSEYKKEIEKKISSSSLIESCEINSIIGTLLINYDNNVEQEKIITIVDNILGEYSLKLFKSLRELEKVDLNTVDKNEETSKDILKKIALNVGVLGYSVVKGKLDLKDLDNEKIFGKMGRFITVPSIASIYLNKGLFKNGIINAVKNKKPNADTLTLTSIVSSLILGNDKSALMITLLSDVAELMTTYTMERTRNSIKNMLSVSDKEVWKISDDGELKKVPIESIVKEDKVIIYTGEKICVDGEVVEGEAVVDQSSVTGEFVPVIKRKGDNVFAGTVIKSGSITVRTEKAGDDTVVSRIIHLVENAASKKAPIQDYADKFSNYLVPFNFLFAGLTYMFTKSTSRSLNMMIIDYSCGIKLSTATAFSATINNAVKNGVLVKGGNHLEALSNSDTLILDKTGTLTEGKPTVTDIKILNNSYSEHDVLKIAGAAEETSSHPMSVAIMNEVEDRGIEIPSHVDVVTHIARGMETSIENKKVLVGSKIFLEENNINTKNITPEIQSLKNGGANLIYVAYDNELIAVIFIKDKMRENMRKAINNLRYQGVDDILLLTGDLEAQAKEVANLMGVDGYKSELLPSDKAEEVLRYQSKGAKVIMVGDGINDAPALAYSDVGIALGGGSTDVAMETADITIQGDNPMMLPTIIDLSKKTMNVVKQNFGLVIGINSAGLILSAAGVLPVFFGAVLHNSSTILVVANSLRLMFFNMERGV